MKKMQLVLDQLHYRFVAIGSKGMGLAGRCPKRMTEGDLEGAEPQMSPGLGYMESGVKSSYWELARWLSRHRDLLPHGTA